MGLAGGNRPHPRAVIFDLDRCLIDPRKAWRYCIEESIAAALGQRIDASELVEEYHTRPWRDALGVLTDSAEAARCADLCATMFERSAMKKLLVHEGVGMALDALRGERIELGAISRLTHGLAVKQVQSTGLDRFLAVVATTPADERWDPGARIEQCLSFLESGAARSAFVSGDGRDLEAAVRGGVRPYAAGWGGSAAEHDDPVPSPADVLPRVLRDWGRLRG
jgi:phosphoglycolate phosphatase-like HAD superfamily hydrolase